MESAESLRKSLPKGTRLMLTRDLPSDPELYAGLKGSVDFIDESCDIHMNWDNGSTTPITVNDNWKLI